jgi:WD40 repeat protein
MLWDVQSGQRLDTLPGKEYSDQVNYLVFNKSGDEFAGNRSGKIYIYKAKTRELVKTLGNENSNSSVTSLTYSPDGRLLLVTSLDGTATVWDVKKNKKVILNGHKNGVLRGSFHPDGQQIVTSSQDGALIFWKITGEEIHRVQVLDPKDENSFLVTFSPDGKKFATLSHDNVAIWDSYSHQKIVDLPPFKTEQYKRFFYMSFGFSQDGKRLYVGDLSGRLGYWEQLE